MTSKSEWEEFMKTLKQGLGDCVYARSKFPVRDHAFLDKQIEGYTKMIDNCDHFLKKMDVPVTYNMFRQQRVRMPVTQEEKDECRDDPVRTNRIKTVANAWRKDRHVDLPMKGLVAGLEEEFGAPVNGNEWPMIKVFGSDDAVADWDANHT